MSDRGDGRQARRTDRDIRDGTYAPDAASLATACHVKVWRAYLLKLEVRRDVPDRRKRAWCLTLRGTVLPPHKLRGFA
ncbi:MAG TPA: hypothetical protein PK770_00430 [Kiritimatiellia bacterium]|nr:hypothetical protein [Kiritimatiellia bacterium]HOM58306.1 hypothetical protein [Kiritimatiellia bacterium]HOR96879.1 hypothetical protein [Kiritimatiellia bacterium]